ncbi:adenosylmethionine-8-amino-7-oxononanoate aminotransferase [Paraburkholderia fungorum]|uniref:Adenosylmethionine-8-amino-7-oxononanoate aminotransferase n=1 Tax=Paraburkholderia fungorum TaxID=134537 RepID=A0AAW3VBF0_9BURK|nr:adenosylmethionine-8-amino-7-oxononanoate aminotransferase [Paraburkholderia fungorum]MBB6206821.1 adenosylmethionine-8-amino-7-oxononanoate aminotransferase [Paraburkholderia fungorum]
MGTNDSAFWHPMRHPAEMKSKQTASRSTRLRAMPTRWPKWRAHGALVRPVGTKIILSPPLVVGSGQLDALARALAASFDAVKFA